MQYNVPFLICSVYVHGSVASLLWCTFAILVRASAASFAAGGILLLGPIKISESSFPSRLFGQTIRGEVMRNMAL